MPRIAILETAEWYENDRITSVKTIFSILAQLEEGDPNEFLYSTFVNENSFKHTLRYFSNLNAIRYIYIGSHGAEAGEDHLVTPAEDETVSRTEILNRIDTDNIWGVFLSACNSDMIAQYIAENVDNDIWIAGYGDRVEWVKSTAFEMLFWQAIYGIGGPRVNRQDARNQLRQALEGHRDLINDLSFYLWFNEGGEVIDLADFG